MQQVELAAAQHLLLFKTTDSAPSGGKLKWSTNKDIFSSWQVELAAAQHLLKPCFCVRNVYNYGLSPLQREAVGSQVEHKQGYCLSLFLQPTPADSLPFTDK